MYRLLRYGKNKCMKYYFCSHMIKNCMTAVAITAFI